jgi:hypothetical protein
MAFAIHLQMTGLTRDYATAGMESTRCGEREEDDYGPSKAIIPNRKATGVPEER